MKQIIAILGLTVAFCGDSMRMSREPAGNGWLFLPSLHQCIVDDNLEKMERLLQQKDTDVNEKAVGGMTPLHIAAMRGKRDIAEKLLQRGADINAQDMQGRSPLHIAVIACFIDVVDLFCSDENLDINIKDSAGKTPLVYAEWDSYQPLIDLLRKHGALGIGLKN